MNLSSDTTFLDRITLDFHVCVNISSGSHESLIKMTIKIENASKNR